MTITMRQTSSVRRTYALLSAWWGLALLCASPNIFAQPTINPEGVSQYFDRVLQIVVIESDTGNKISLGSGFQVQLDEGGVTPAESVTYVVTNYHVISGVVFEPDFRHIEYLDYAGERGRLQLVAFDVVNDLALLTATDVAPTHLSLSSGVPLKGESIYSLGNPHDLGMLIVEGGYNGLSESSDIPRVLSTGSLNSGMSGGPTLNAAGQVVGVNVARAGSQLSFLVPASAVKSLLARYQAQPNPLPTTAYMDELAQQIRAQQEAYFGKIFDTEWPAQRFGTDATVVGEILPDISCWGHSNEERRDDRHAELILSCGNGNSIFVGNNLDTGQLHYSFYSYRNRSMGEYQFHQLISDHSFSPDNSAGRRSVTPFQCEQDYVENATSGDAGYQQVGLCMRSYLLLDGLYDVLFYFFQADEQRALVSHFTLSAVGADTADRFTKQFMERAQWN